MVAKGGERRAGQGGGWDEQIQAITHGWINNKVLVYSSGNHIQQPVTNYSEKKQKRRYIYIYTHTHTHIYMYGASWVAQW